MKITAVTTFPVKNPTPGRGGPLFLFVKLRTDSGVEGIGEIFGLPFSGLTAAAMAEDVCERMVIGTNPFEIEKLWRRIYSSGYTQHPDLSLMAILSGIEMACWDIIGKELDRPVYELLGGRVHERLRSYTYLYSEEEDATDVYLDPDLAAERAAQYVDWGFTAIKFDPAGAYSAFDPRQLSMEALDRTERYTRQIREAVGSRADLLVGTHGQMTPASAIRLAKRLEKYDPLWFEEPTPPENAKAMATVAQGTSIPVATGERLSTKYDFARVLEAQAAAILQLNLGRCGGILEAKKIASMAESYYAQIAPHLYCGPIVGAANIQISTCSPNFLILEGIQDWGGFHAEILRTPIQWEEGYVIPSKEPGLGVELNEEVALKHRFEDQILHQNPEENPLI
jgi:galactonate dehydratase